MKEARRREGAASLLAALQRAASGARDSRADSRLHEPHPARWRRARSSRPGLGDLCWISTPLASGAALSKHQRTFRKVGSLRCEMEVGLGLLSAPRPRHVAGARPAPRRAPSSRAGLLLRGQSSQAALSWEVGVGVGVGKPGYVPRSV